MLWKQILGLYKISSNMKTIKITVLALVLGFGVSLLPACKKLKDKYDGPIYCTYYITGNGFNNFKVESFFTSAEYGTTSQVTVFDLGGMRNTTFDILPPDFTMKMAGKGTGVHDFSNVNKLIISFKDRRNGADSLITLQSVILNTTNDATYQGAGKIDISRYGIQADAIAGTFEGELVEGRYDPFTKKAVVGKKYTIKGEFAVDREIDGF